MVYFGLRFPENGLQPKDEKVRAIKNAPILQNISELRSFLKILAAMDNFILKLSTLAYALCKLLGNMKMRAELRQGLLGY